MTTSCCKPCNNKSLTEKQYKEIEQTIPDYPRLDLFTIEERKRIASLPPLYKEYNLKILNWTKCIIYGLDYLHKRKLIHRDIRPE